VRLGFGHRGVVRTLGTVPQRGKAIDLLGRQAEGVFSGEQVLRRVQHHLHHGGPHLLHHVVAHHHVAHGALPHHGLLRSEWPSHQRDRYQQRLADHGIMLPRRLVNTNAPAR